MGVVLGKHAFQLSLYPLPKAAMLTPSLPALKMAEAGGRRGSTSLPLQDSQGEGDQVCRGLRSILHHHPVI